MKKAEAETIANEAKERVEAVFPQYSKLIDSTPIILSSSRDKEKVISRLAATVGADYDPATPGTRAEALVGTNGNAIIIFYFSIDERQLPRVIYHELGHIISVCSCNNLIAEARQDIVEKRDTLLGNGVSLWNEFITEVIAYRVEGYVQRNTWHANFIMERLIDEAVNEERFNQYPFAFYCAMRLVDPAVAAFLNEHPSSSAGMDRCDDEIVPLIENTLAILSQQINKAEYWIIDRKTLIALGECFNDLWDYCSLKRFDVKFEEFKRYLSDN